jgi:phage terminase small subunit
VTAKHRRFVAEYLVDLNGTQAAIRAGYSARTAQEQSSALLSKPMVAAAVAVGQAKRLARLKITQEKVLQEIASIAFSDVRQWFNQAGQLLPIDALPDRVAAAVASVDVKRKKIAHGHEVIVTEECLIGVKAWDKLKALEILAKRFGLVKEQVVHSGKVTVTFGGRYKPDGTR